MLGGCYVTLPWHRVTFVQWQSHGTCRRKRSRSFMRSFMHRWLLQSVRLSCLFQLNVIGLCMHGRYISIAYRQSCKNCYKEYLCMSFCFSLLYCALCFDSFITAFLNMLVIYIFFLWVVFLWLFLIPLKINISKYLWTLWWHMHTIFL